MIKTYCNSELLTWFLFDLDSGLQPRHCCVSAPSRRPENHQRWRWVTIQTSDWMMQLNTGLQLVLRGRSGDWGLDIDPDMVTWPAADCLRQLRRLWTGPARLHIELTEGVFQHLWAFQLEVLMNEDPKHPWENWKLTDVGPSPGIRDSEVTIDTRNT